MTEVTILAVTRLSSGVCVAGITIDGEWIRPTRPRGGGWRYLDYANCEDESGRWIIRKGNIVRMDLIKHIPEGAHSEDWLIGNRKPELIKELSDEDYQSVCEEFTEDMIDTLDCEDAERSLILVHPDKISSFSFEIETSWEGKKKYIPRGSFRLDRNPYPNMGITDVEWRGYGRQVMREHKGYCLLKANEIFEKNNTNDCWLTIGRNLLRSGFYLLVVGVHLFPVRHFDMDFIRS